MPRRDLDTVVIRLVAKPTGRVAFPGGQRGVELIVAGWAALAHRRQGAWVWTNPYQDFSNWFIEYRVDGVRVTRRDIEELAQLLLPSLTNYTVVYGYWETDADDWQVWVEMTPNEPWEKIRAAIEEGPM